MEEEVARQARGTLNSDNNDKILNYIIITIGVGMKLLLEISMIKILMLTLAGELKWIGYLLIHSLIV